MKKKITESQLRKMISESVKKVLKEYHTTDYNGVFNNAFDESYDELDDEYVRSGEWLHDVEREVFAAAKKDPTFLDKFLCKSGNYEDNLSDAYEYLRTKNGYNYDEYDYDSPVGISVKNNHNEAAWDAKDTADRLYAPKNQSDFEDIYDKDDIYDTVAYTNDSDELFTNDYSKYYSPALDDKYWKNNKKALRESVKKVLKEGQSDGNLIEKWNYWCANFDHDFIQQAWAQDRMMAKHLEEKFNECYKIAGTYGAMTKFYLELDGRNRRVLENYIINNY